MSRCTGTGTGGGIAIDARVLVGHNAVAGEWGHNALPWPHPGEWPGPSCYCGRTGCIETFLAGPGLSRDYLSASDLIVGENTCDGKKKGWELFGEHTNELYVMDTRKSLISTGLVSSRYSDRSA